MEERVVNGLSPQSPRERRTAVDSKREGKYMTEKERRKDTHREGNRGWGETGRKKNSEERRWFEGKGVHFYLAG